MCVYPYYKIGDETVMNGLDRNETLLILMGLNETASMSDQTYPFPIFTEYIYV